MGTVRPGRRQGLHLDRPHEIARYDAAFADMWDTSLSEEASRSLLTNLAGTQGS
ncbi:Scr1 family TA system antitoxin-like transcriptional regulator [Streptomyces radicis]|uniref:Scr1 family TA system antitoxin-like transcriptional regulator n=1 Tax=Streptomyces radicis TaxID=1750517 RepID=UPI001C7E0A98